MTYEYVGDVPDVTLPSQPDAGAGEGAVEADVFIFCRIDTTVHSLGICEGLTAEAIAYEFELNANNDVTPQARRSVAGGVVSLNIRIITRRAL